MEKKSLKPTPAKTSGEPKPVPARRAGRGASADKSSVDADPVKAQAADTQALVASMAHNANKDLDFGRDNALNPPVGVTAEAASDAVSASTLSEVNVSAKTGEPASPGGHAIDGRLAQARVDGSNQVLTTNQGVAIADNQNSLKAGLRGPTLLVTVRRRAACVDDAFRNALVVEVRDLLAQDEVFHGPPEAQGFHRPPHVRDDGQGSLHARCGPRDRREVAKLAA